MRELKPNDLKWTCSPEVFSFRTTGSIKPLQGIFGQAEALKALKTGIEIRKSGYNVFVAGPHASGRRALIRECLRRFIPKLPPQPDLVYVNNFYAPHKPRLLTFPAGRGGAFVDKLDALMATITQTYRDMTQDAGNQKKLKSLQGRFENRFNRIRSQFEKDARQYGFFVGQLRSHEGQRNPDLFYIFNDKPISMEELEEQVFAGNFPPDQFSKLRRLYTRKKKELNMALTQITRLNQQYIKDLEAFEHRQVKVVLERELREMVKAFPMAGVKTHLNDLKQEILSQLKRFRAAAQEPGDASDKDQFRDFRANLIASSAPTTAAAKKPPVVFENNPSFSNLFGFIEKPGGDDGGGPSDFMDIRPGAIIEANHGFIVLDISLVLQSPTLWNVLKTTVRTGNVTVQEPEGMSSPGSGLKPEPVPVDIKVILVGEPHVFDMLYDIDPEFRHNFKVCVKLEPDFPLARRLLKNQLPGFIAKICANEGLAPLNRDAVCEVAEFGVRLSGQKNKFTGSLGNLADLLREADWCAKCDKKRTVNRSHIRAAIKQSIRRLNSAERRLSEAIANGTVMIQTKGAVLGQINGLAVYDLGDYSFGRPAKITAETSVGDAGIINIEREAGMSGVTHDKGVHILTGYMRTLFAQERPMSLTASICFEQSYSMIDGDSASSTEVYALLSSLSGLPIRQDIAVTGSVNQKGEIQSIGCVNEKIEGFFDIIHGDSPTGREGVIIPHANLQDLMLRDDVIQSVKQGRFHIWTVKSVEEGIELLTGVKAGRRRKNGTWSPGSVFDRVDKRLAELKRHLQKPKSD